MQTLAQMVFVFIGLVVIAQHTPLPAGFERGLLIGLIVLTSGLLTGIVMQRRGMFSAARASGRPRSASACRSGWASSSQQLDAEIARFYTAPRAFALSVLGFFVGWCMGVVEVYIVLHFLDVGATLSRAMTIEVLSVAIDALFFFVPAKAGTQEGGKVLIFQMLGLDPVKGLALGIVRRLRELSWSMVGLVVLARHHARRRAVDAVSPARRLIVSADDFGMSAGVNAGIIRAHRDGILGDASLMVNGQAFAEAVELARAPPRASASGCI